jgi:DegV family protein with EDD domain
MKQHLALVTDSSADMPATLSAELGVIVVPTRFAFDQDTHTDQTLSAEEFYGRMRAEAHPPRTFGAPEAAFRAAFEQALEGADSVLCLVTPFDVSPSFTTASAATLSMDDVDIKILNPGVASAGLCALLTSLAPGVAAGWTREQVISVLDVIEPQCDTLFVPADVKWLEQAGRLPLIEDRIGEVEASTPIVRVGTRITGVALEPTRTAAIARAVAAAGTRADPGSRLNVTVTHADAPQLADEVAARMQARWDIARLVITELGSTLGSQLGPGTIGIGVAPVAAGEGALGAR